MTLFLLSIWCVDSEFINIVHSLRQLSVSIHWWFQGLQGRCIHWRFMDQQWHGVFWEFHASSMTLFLLSIWCVHCEFIDAIDSIVYCHLVFSDDFNVYRYSDFADDLWISSDMAFFSIPCVSHDSIFAINLRRRSWIYWCCRLDMSAITQYSLTITRSTVSLISLTIYGSDVKYHFWWFYSSPISLFLLSIWCIGREIIDVVDYIRRLSLNIHWRLQGLQWLCFRWRFKDQQWHSVFYNSMHRPWLYFCYRYDASIVNSLTLSIPYVSCQSVFIDDFKVYRDVVFTDDLWINSDMVFFGNSMHHPWLYFCYRFDASVVDSLMLSIPYVCCHSVFSDDFNVYRDSDCANDLCISSDLAFLTIPGVIHDSIFAIDLRRR
jgi:hypothetical protein